MISLIKFFSLAAFTVFLTVVIFRFVRTSPNHEVTTPAAALLVADSDSPKGFPDSRQSFNGHLNQVSVHYNGKVVRCKREQV